MNPLTNTCLYTCSDKIKQKFSLTLAYNRFNICPGHGIILYTESQIINKLHLQIGGHLYSFVRVN